MYVDNDVPVLREVRAVGACVVGHSNPLPAMWAAGIVCVSVCTYECGEDK